MTIRRALGWAAAAVLMAAAVAGLGVVVLVEALVRVVDIFTGRRTRG